MIEYRWAEGHLTELDALANELVSDRVALIAATGGGRSAQAARRPPGRYPSCSSSALTQSNSDSCGELQQTWW